MKKICSVLLTVCLCLNALTFVGAWENVSMSDAELPYGKTGGWFTGAENQPKENPAEFIFETPEGTR